VLTIPPTPPSAPHDKIWYTEDPDDTDEVDWSKWRGLIHAKSLADLEVIAHAKSDIEALIAEVELLRSLMDP
jgi:hypothetical protein